MLMAASKRYERIAEARLYRAQCYDDHDEDCETTNGLDSDAFGSGTVLQDVVQQLGRSAAGRQTSSSTTDIGDSDAPVSSTAALIKDVVSRNGSSRSCSRTSASEDDLMMDHEMLSRSATALKDVVRDLSRRSRSLETSSSGSSLPREDTTILLQVQMGWAREAVRKDPDGGWELG